MNSKNVQTVEYLIHELYVIFPRMLVAFVGCSAQQMSQGLIQCVEVMEKPTAVGVCFGWQGALATK